MKTLMITILAIIACIPKITNAQTDSLKLKNGYYVGVGIAAGKGSHTGIYVLSNIQVQHFQSYLSFKGSTFAIFTLDNSSAPNISELGFLFGKSYTLGESHNFQFGGGLSMVTSISRGKLITSTCKKGCILLESNTYETIREKSVGLPLEVKYNFYLNRTGAISLSLNGNLNKQQSFFGAAVGFTSGRLRPRFKK
jgi:hypothetical protein